MAIVSDWFEEVKERVDYVVENATDEQLEQILECAEEGHCKLRKTNGSFECKAGEMCGEYYG